MAAFVKKFSFILLVVLGMGQVTTLKAYQVERNEARVEFRQESASRTSWFYNTLAINYVTLNAIDLVTTFHGLGNGAREVNPIARTFVKNKPLAVAVKAGATVTVLYALSKAKKHNRKVAYIALGTLNVIYGLVVTNNVRVTMNLN